LIKNKFNRLFLLLSCLLLLNLNARAEEISLYTSQPLSDISSVIEKFQSLHQDIKVNVFRSGTSDIILKLSVEQKANKAKADLVLLSDSVAMEHQKTKDLLGTLDYGLLSSITHFDKICDADQYYCGTKIIATGIAFSKDVHNIHSWKDLLNKDLKGEIVIADPNYSGAAALQYSAFVHSNNQDLQSFYNRLRDQEIVIVPSNGQVLEYLTKGLKKVGVIVDFMAIRAKNSGTEIDFIYPSDGSVIITEPVAILASSAHKKAVHTFINFLLSKDIEPILKNQNYTNINQINDLSFKLLPYNPNLLVNNYEEDKEDFSKTFRITK